MLILKPHLMFTTTVVCISSPGVVRNCSFPADFTQLKTPPAGIDQQYAGHVGEIDRLRKNRQNRRSWLN
jgi:hypothetical protein